jgi:bifunctional pyridoxal-dependent enzyme with beta-cystathionase and maltose regulon repressor activities
VFAREELEKLGRFCEEHDIILCSDEIHADLMLEPRAVHVPAGSVRNTVLPPMLAIDAVGLRMNTWLSLRSRTHWQRVR